MSLLQRSLQSASSGEVDLPRRRGMESLPPQRGCRPNFASQMAFARDEGLDRQQRPHPRAEEDKSFELLVCAYRELGQSHDDEYQDKLSRFLTVLETTVRTLDVETESRLYRDKFISGYRNLFPDYNLRYRFEIFDASFMSHPVLWVNGEEFEFSPKAFGRAKALQDAFAWLHNSLGVEDASAHSPPLQLLRCQLAQLDKAWAHFEMTYISELIAIENKSKDLVVQAIKEEKLLHGAESRHARIDSTQILEQRRKLVSCISKLNSVANDRRKGRSDLDASILEVVEERLREYQRESPSAARAAAALTKGIMDSFNAIRAYFSRVATCLDRVDPDLSKNKGLVDHLVEWEETWEIGAKYVRDESLFKSLVRLVEKLRSVRDEAPGFKDMCIERDVELFLCIPRMIWIHYMHTPADYAALMKTLLPHHFKINADNGRILSLAGRFAELREVCLKHLNAGSQPKERRAYLVDILIERAWSGSSTSTLFDAYVKEPSREVVRKAINAYIHEVESYSMELQRSCTLEWNQCCSLLVQCLDDS
eukprot:CAMPEP_0169120614 /NCGR_PEP_ID=MMETSP1015-20121227/32205_1 /TAXON_ID=342587 /ORGANISM="Karlodinium micrum, Strain CCMP2283" /LENGTH=536 /DNA_ID=CAMNT_0009183615 /DNA_START=1 /DNA_END=1607 /DNA_ORIENTATION=+